MVRRIKTISERFYPFVNPEPNTGCFLWSGVTDSRGYGYVRPYASGGQRRKVSAHRLAYELEFGEIKKGMSVLHRCDTPSCVNPRHLFLGTQADNMLDMTLKNRRSRGEGHHSKLTETMVREIRSSSETQRVLARKYEVKFQTICDIKHKRTWAWLT